ncbi:hypothetical protein [Cellulomonas phragmiteti]|uniref:Alternate-type signal peptide domain-containing protein n=1 Tax=Cellulomonas phragmiteti TaxID=478780 RepID=A0ABQ4DI18_9CELL|nr:hypothetical protein [Cellulomonas phragmiteti]GIG38994.1 hypothetical protein Cph01nite_07560 [Cellulomonas phragmiteti]
MSRRKLSAIGVAAVLAASLAAGVTYTLWSSDAVASVGVLRSGNLDLELVGPVTWTETSPDVVPAHSVPSTDGTAAHLATRGDTFTVSQSFRTTLEGDNLRAVLTVAWQEPASLPAGVTGTYVVTPPSGPPTAPVALGTPLVLPGGAARLGPGVGEWTVTATLSWANAAVVVVSPSALANPAPAPDAYGTLLIDLQQVRDGDGFDS